MWENEWSNISIRIRLWWTIFSENQIYFVICEKLAMPICNYAEADVLNGCQHAYWMFKRIQLYESNQWNNYVNCDIFILFLYLPQFQSIEVYNRMIFIVLNE